MSPPGWTRFQAALHTRFGLQTGVGGEVDLLLVEANNNRTTPREDSVESFSLIFTGPRDRFLPQRTYTFVHESMGRFELFIVPIGQDEVGFRYEAIINRQPIRT